MQINPFDQVKNLFAQPENTSAKIRFGNPPNLPTFEQSKVVVYGVPFDDSATFGKGCERGPEVLRHVSGRQIETFVIDEAVEIYEKTPIFDLGDLRIRSQLSEKECAMLQSEDALPAIRANAIKKLDEVMKQFNILKDVTLFLRSQKKIPLMLGGEHTLSYWPLSALAKENPVVIHFDAHRDAKKEYLGMKMCHTTPMRHFLEENPKIDFVQIGIRQADREENEFADKAGIKTFYPEDINNDLENSCKWLKKKTKGRNIYITFDIDVLDAPYVPCTGTPEPFGLTPEQVVTIFKSIDSLATLVGADMMEVSFKSNDYREATTAAQLLFRLLARDYVRV